MTAPATNYVCGQCGAIRDRQDVVIVREEDFVGQAETIEEMAQPAVARRIHWCGFEAIRCRNHVRADQLATRAVRAHLARVAAKHSQ